GCRVGGSEPEHGGEGVPAAGAGGPGVAAAGCGHVRQGGHGHSRCRAGPGRRAPGSGALFRHGAAGRDDGGGGGGDVRDGAPGTLAGGGFVNGPVALQTTGLGKRYRTLWALRGVDLAIPAGSVAALVGPNGAGKTTLLQLAMGLL